MPKEHESSGLRHQAPRDYCVGGYIPTGQYRVRMHWLGVAVLEQLYEYQDGRRLWRREPVGSSVLIGGKTA